MRKRRPGEQRSNDPPHPQPQSSQARHSRARTGGAREPWSEGSGGSRLQRDDQEGRGEQSRGELPGSGPDVKRYVQALQAMLRERSPRAYRAFLQHWRDLHQRGAAERLLAMDDATLRWRIERMILDIPTLADLHESARAYLREHEALAD